MKQGDILTHPDGHTRRIMAVCGELYALSDDTFHDTYYCWMSESRIKETGYIIPKEQWKPEDEDKVYYIDDCGEIDWKLGEYAKERPPILGIYKTEAEAQIAADKIKDLLKGL